MSRAQCADSMPADASSSTTATSFARPTPTAFSAFPGSSTRAALQRAAAGYGQGHQAEAGPTKRLVNDQAAGRSRRPGHRLVAGDRAGGPACTCRRRRRTRAWVSAGSAEARGPPRTGDRSGRCSGRSVGYDVGSSPSVTPSPVPLPGCARKLTPTRRDPSPLAAAALSRS